MLELLLFQAEALPGAWLSIPAVLAAAGALIGVGRLQEKVRSQGERLGDHEEQLKHRVTKDEFKLVVGKIDAIHEDVREIRQRMP